MNPAMVLSGAAGTGKTHLLCDLAKARVDKKQPTVFLLGQNFCDGEPWGQIINQLQLNCQTKEEFLGILNAAGQASGARALILIDAINESGSKEIWRKNLAGMLEAVKRYPWVGIVLSVRDSYFNYMIPEHLVQQKQLVAVAHKGFAGVEYKAAKEFFRYYNIKQPDVPLLNPEFQNPLFLKLLCCSLKNLEITEFPRGSQNITKVYEDFIDSVNQKLSAHNILDYDPREKIVWKAVEQLASKMGEKYDSRIPRAEAKQIVQDILPSNGYHNSLFHYLETEGIITKCVIYTEESCGEGVQFAYERFADHLIVKYLLDNYLNLDTPELSFADNQPLAFLLREHFWHYEGLIDALSIQLPERIGKDLIELVPEFADRDPIQQAFLDSLVWRTPESITEKATEIINRRILQHRNGYEQLMETFITVAGIVGHPYNADKLHKWLLKENLAKRDATWSIFLFYQIEENGAVDRLIDWAWSCEDKSDIGDESILLLAKTLAWFLTTSQRYLRDRATKAMVNLLTDRIHLLSSLLEEFKDVNDPYVAERLYAVAYGCAMRTTEKNKICDLASYIYENIFKDGTPPVHVLLRDYARGVIELAVHYGLKTNACLKKIRPPYKSTWPNDIPSKDELENLYSYDAEKRGVETNEHLRRLYNHIASSGFSDFNRYIIEHGCYNWTSRRKGEPKKVTNKDRYNSFVESLTSKQKKAWDEVNERRSSAIRIVVSDSDNKQISEIKPSSDAENLLEEAENDFIKTLGEKKRIRYFEFVILYLNRELPQDEYELFDKSLAESFIFKRVLDLGWSPKLHAEFDDNRHDMQRRANKPERIGKKYQWIAYHELLALISDHFEYKEDSWSGDKNYEGPWQSYIRDIDPSYVLSGNKQEYWATSHSTTWWFPIMYNAWDEEPDDSVWLQKDNDLPLIKKMIEVSNDNGSKWLCLKSHYNLREPIPPEEEYYEKEKREVWYMIKSYLVKKGDMRTLYDWAQKQDFFGDWMPESHATTGIFLGEYYWSPAFRFHDQPYYYHEGWTKGREDGRYELPVPAIVSNDGYLQEDGCYDCSINDTVNISLPAKTLVEEMQLSWNGHEGEWYDCDDNLIAFDPSVRQKGPGCLLLEKEAFMKYLDKMGYDVLWTILGEKQMIGGPMCHGNWKGRLTINGVAKLEAGEVVTQISQNYQSA